MLKPSKFCKPNFNRFSLHGVTPVLYEMGQMKSHGILARRGLARKCEANLQKKRTVPRVPWSSWPYFLVLLTQSESWSYIIVLLLESLHVFLSSLRGGESTLEGSQGKTCDAKRTCKTRTQTALGGPVQGQEGQGTRSHDMAHTLEGLLVHIPIGIIFNYSRDLPHRVREIIPVCQHMPRIITKNVAKTCTRINTYQHNNQNMTVILPHSFIWGHPEMQSKKETGAQDLRINEVS